jgi:peptidoglycan/LPS O-acetylase OafA/YrhL
VKAKLAKLEMMRGFAALYVMAGYLIHHNSLGFGARVDKWIAEPMRFDQEAVMLFFLISGFVIFYSTEKKRPDFATYLSHRWKRIYPIFLLSLCLVGMDLVLLKSEPFPWRDFWGNLFMFQDRVLNNPGVWFPTFGNNRPLWSLAYEWWFYLLFYPIWRFAPVKRQRMIAAAISFFGLMAFALHPNQLGLYLAYFILWWTGAELGRQYAAEGRVTFHTQRITLAVLAGFSGLTAGALLLANHYNHWQAAAWPGAGAYPFLEIHQFVSCLLIVVAALVWQRHYWTGFDLFFGIFKYAAPISYGLYVLHYPLMITGSFFSFVPAGRAKLIILILAGLAAAWLAEGPFQKLANHCTRFLPNRTLGIPSGQGPRSPAE